MATILEFKFAPRPTAASVLAACNGAETAEIVFFPGVRYERQPEDAKMKSHKERNHEVDCDD